MLPFLPEMGAERLFFRYGEDKKVDGVIYMQRISDPRMGGAQVRNARMFRKLCGHTSMSNVVIVTTFWDRVQPDEGAKREKELKEKFFDQQLSQGANMLRYDRRTSQNSARGIVEVATKNDPKALRIQKQMVDYKKALPNTDAAQELYVMLKRQMKDMNEEMDKLEEDIRSECFVFCSTQCQRFNL